MANTLELKPWQALILGGIIVAVIGAAVWVFLNQQSQDQDKENNTSQPTPTVSATPQASVTPTPTINPVSQELQLFMVALEAGSGDNSFGCGDRLESVKRTLTTASPLRDILTELLDYPNQYYGQSGLYNALHASDLKVQSVNIVNGRADIQLTGTLVQQGTCDAPRIQEQLKATALQFDTVTSTNITVNGQALDQALSSR